MSNDTGLFFVVLWGPFFSHYSVNSLMRIYEKLLLRDQLLSLRLVSSALFFVHYLLLQSWLVCSHFAPPQSTKGGCVRLFVCLINNCWPVYYACALLFFVIFVCPLSRALLVPLCLLPAETSGWSWLLVQRAPPAANEVKLHVHAPRLAVCGCVCMLVALGA